MKTGKWFQPEAVRRFQYPFYALFFASFGWESLHRKAVGETVLYSVALAASVFLGVLQLRGFDVRSGKWGAVREERQGETKP